MKTPLISSPTELLNTQFLKIKRFRADFGSFSKNYDVVVFGPRAGMVAIRDGKILMTKQYRFLPNAWTWEIPGGTVDNGELSDQAAQRECLEETGVYCCDLRPLITYYPGLDNVDNKTSLFVSRNTTQAHAFVPSKSEVTEIAWMSIDDLLTKIGQGEIVDAFTLIAIFSYLRSSKHAPW
jgi:ADP-ribose pyrophosphatase